MEKSCFVISAIGLPGSRERKHADLVLNYIIRPVAEQAGYMVGRSDHGAASAMITVGIVRALLDSDIVVADLSFLNPNVFYELGLRHSTRTKHTIHIASHDTQVPFDNADHRTIFYDISDWDSHNRAKESLRQYLAAIEREEIGVINPLTVAEAHQNDARLSVMLDRVDQLLVTLEEKISHLSDEPEPGQISREKYREITERHRREIQTVVNEIKRRIDARQVDPQSEQAPKVMDVLQRLRHIEQIVLPNNPSPIFSAPLRPQ